MKQYTTLHIIILLLSSLLAACTDDAIIDFDDAADEASDGVYTLQLAIDGGPQGSRSSGTINDIDGIKAYWCYGDKVVLRDQAGTSYTFTINTPSGHEVGERVGSVATFSYSGGSISGFTNFTGTLTYETGTSMTETKSNGTIHCSINPGGVAFDTDYFNFYCHNYSLQKYNKDAGHLGCLTLSATLSGVNLKNKNIITLGRNYSIVKIIIDDICTPYTVARYYYLKASASLV